MLVWDGSGVDVNHIDFEGRAFWGGNFVPGSPDTDENGHGTIIAGIAAGTSYGVAKKANIISVKVRSHTFLSCMLTFMRVPFIVLKGRRDRKHRDYH
jgi:hypothetical protein